MDGRWSEGKRETDWIGTDIPLPRVIRVIIGGFNEIQCCTWIGVWWRIDNYRGHSWSDGWEGWERSVPLRQKQDSATAMEKTCIHIYYLSMHSPCCTTPRMRMIIFQFRFYANAMQSHPGVEATSPAIMVRNIIYMHVNRPDPCHEAWPFDNSLPHNQSRITTWPTR